MRVARISKLVTVLAIVVAAAVPTLVRTPDGLEARCRTRPEPPVRPAAARAHPAVDGWSGDQLANAAIVMDTARAMGLPPQAELVGVMTAMGESSLRNLGYGDDAVNPDGTIADSVGLFQQQHFWGTREQRLDPAFASAAFCRALERVDGSMLRGRGTRRAGARPPQRAAERLPRVTAIASNVPSSPTPASTTPSASRVQ